MKCNLFFINATLFLIRCTVYLLSQKCFYYIKNLINLKSWVTTAEFGAFVVAHSFPDQGKKENVNSISTTNKPRSRMCVFTFSIEKHSYGGEKSRKFPFSLPFVSCKISMSPRVRAVLNIFLVAIHSRIISILVSKAWISLAYLSLSKWNHRSCSLM